MPIASASAVHVLLLGDEDVLEERFRAVVADVAASLDVLVQHRDRLHLEREVVPEHLRRAGADVELPEALEVRQTVEEEDALDELVRMLHLVDRLLVDPAAEVLVTPVLAHARVQEILVDGGVKPKPEFANCVFLQADGEIYTLNRDNNDWARLLKSHGLPHWTGHKNRFITAVWLAAQKPVVPVQTIQSVLGHKSTALALYYQKTSIEQQMAPMKLYGEKLARGKKSG